MKANIKISIVIERLTTSCNKSNYRGVNIWDAESSTISFFNSITYSRLKIKTHKFITTMKKLSSLTTLLLLTTLLKAQTPAIIKDINPSPSSGFNSTGNSLATLGNILYFSADDGSSGAERWRSGRHVYSQGHTARQHGQRPGSVQRAGQPSPVLCERRYAWRRAMS